MKNYYAVLLITTFSDERMASRAYRALAKNYHPDNNPDDPNAESMMKALNEAKEVLCNEDRKKKYDLDLYAELHAPKLEFVVEEELYEARDYHDVARATEELTEKTFSILVGLSCFSLGLAGVVCGLFFLLTGERSKRIQSFIAGALGLVVQIVLGGLIWGLEVLGEAYGLKL